MKRKRFSVEQVIAVRAEFPLRGSYLLKLPSVDVSPPGEAFCTREAKNLTKLRFLPASENVASVTGGLQTRCDTECRICKLLSGVVLPAAVRSEGCCVNTLRTAE